MGQASFLTSTLIKCPYCGIENKVIIYSDQLHTKTVTYCDVEIGGCDEQFAYSVEFSVETEVFKFEKVETHPLDLPAPSKRTS